MRRINVYITLTCTLLLWFALPGEFILAQDKSVASSGTADSGFELKDGDRVVFLGNSLFENDLRHGYLEMALTTRWPHAAVTFRNIGWNGDTVWGEARTYVSPPSGYSLLLEQLAKCKPTIVFIAYGAVESEKGEAGLTRFIEGLVELLNEIDRLGARPVLLSPLPLMTVDATADILKRNAMLERYAASIAEIASDRNVKFIDIYNPILQRNKQIKLSDNGIHLNEYGYYYLADIMEKGLGLAPRNGSVSIDVSQTAANAGPSLNLLDSDKENLTFSINQPALPLPLPDSPDRPAGLGPEFKVRGLKNGYYTLSVDGSQIVTASAGKWEDGIEMTQGPYLDRSNQLSDLILKKNELFFHQYRPPNKTYILGFRSHEQGRHAEGLEDLSIIITWLEGQIALHRLAEAKVFQLTRVEEQRSKRKRR